MKQRNFFRRLFSVLAMIAFSSLSYSYPTGIGSMFAIEDDDGTHYVCSITSDSTLALVYVDGPVTSVNLFYTFDNKYKLTEICQAAFKTAPNIRNVYIPGNITKIGPCAFQDCKNLSEVSFGEGLMEIGEYAFSGCSSLASIIVRTPTVRTNTLPSTITKIGTGAFINCSSLTSITLPSTLTKIGNSTFKGCSSLTSITIPQPLESLGDSAFYRSGLTSVNLPMMTMNVKSKYFSGYAETFSDIKNGNNTSTEGSGRRWDCSESVNIASVSNVFQAGGAVRLGTGSVGSLTTVPLKVQKGRNVTIEIDVKGWTTVEGKLLVDLTGCNQQSVSYSATINDNFETVVVEFKNIPESDPALTISTSAKRCFIDEIRIKGIEDYHEEGPSIGNGVFYGCKDLKTATISGSVTSIGNYTFEGCSSLTSISIPESVTSIGNYTFDGCSSLTSISIPGSVTSIGNYTFEGCSSLTSISIPGSVTSIGRSAFSGCTSLTSISIPKSVTSIGRGIFTYRNALTSITVAADNPVYDSREGCNAIIETASNRLIAGCQNTIIPESVTSIGEEAFNGCSSLTSISIPESVTSIESWAFGHCGLTTITFPMSNSTLSIAAGAFNYCSSLTSIISQRRPLHILMGSDRFYDVDKTIPVYVPSAFMSDLELSSISTGWKDFTNILPIEEGFTVSVGAEGLSTYCPPVGVDFSNAENIAAYRAAVDGCTVTLTRADKVDAGEGVLLRSLEGGAVEENLPLSLYPENAENAFVGTPKSITIYETDEEGNTNFVLSKVNGVVGFYKAKQSGTYIWRKNAYLPVPDYDSSADIKGLSLVFEDGFATGIDIVDSVQEQASDDDTYYTLGGVPVKNPTQKGIYIRGGKKYIVK